MSNRAPKRRFGCGMKPESGCLTGRRRIAYHEMKRLSWGGNQFASALAIMTFNRSMTRNILLRGVFWVGIYLALVLAPLIVMLLRPVPAGLGFWRDLSVALGFAGTSMAAIMFVLTARFRRTSAPFGIDIIYYFHRQIALVTLAIVVAHPLILLLVDRKLLILLTGGPWPWSLRTGLVALVLFVIIVGSSLFRRQLDFPYDSWRIWHAIFAPLALLATILHVRAVGYYLDTPWKGLLWILIVASVILILLYVRLLKPALLLRRPYLVEKRITEVPGTWTLVLRPAGSHSFRFQAGQFAWLTIWHSPFALKEHPFSISSSADRPERLSFTIKAAGDFTSKIKEVEPGERVYVDGPYGAFSFERYPAPAFVFIGGGIGSAPLMSMLRTLADRGDRRPVQFIYGGGRPHRLLFTEEIARLRQVLDLDVITVLDKAPADWQGETGLITAELLGRRLPADRMEREYFICGPVPMLHLVEKGLHRIGVPLTRIHSELFDLV
jgi:predicted ferric reductase